MEMPHDYIKSLIKSTIKDAFRTRTKQRFSCPDTLDSLRALVEAQDPQPTCNCDQCVPRLYKSHWNCKIHPHNHPKLILDSTRNEFGNECYKPLKINFMLRTEAMELARTAVKYFDRPLESLNNTQLAALTNLQIWIREHMSLFFAIAPSISSSAGLDTIFSTSSMRELWKHINVLFFDSDIPHRLSSFRWATTTLDSDYEPTIGMASARAFRYTIDILASLDCLSMLSTLLHEACHIFDQYYACQGCCSTKLNLNMAGHGRAWQVLASAVERKFVEFTGLPADLGRLDSLLVHWEQCWPLPSMHDLEVWQLDRQALMKVYETGLLEAVRRYVRVGGNDEKIKDFPLKGFMEYWWVDTQQAENIAKEGEMGDGMDLFQGNTVITRADFRCVGVELEQEQSNEEGEHEEESREVQSQECL